MSNGAELFHVEGQTDRDMTKLIVALQNFANIPDYGGICVCVCETKSQSQNSQMSRKASW